MVGTASRVRLLAADTEHGLQPVIDEPYPLEVIAAALKHMAKTVRNHVSNILHKLKVADRTEAIIRAREAGLR